jgi:hypothetical protein
MQVIKEAKDWICDWSVKPDFKQIVEKSLTLFGVFTGVTLSFYIKDFLFVDKVPLGFAEFSLWSRALIATSVTTLLLRYIIGSAVHLNVTYVPAVNDVFRQKSGDDGMEFAIEERKLKSESLGLLFFDILVLLVFGMFAVSITYALDFEEFMWRSFYFMMVGVVWGVIAALFRDGDRDMAERWLAIDVFQLAITMLLIKIAVPSIAKVVVLAIVFVLCLFLDLCMVSRPPPKPKPSVEGCNGARIIS